MAARETYDIVIDWDYPMSRERVFHAWVDPETVTEWFAPPGFTITQCELEASVGGPWHIEYVDPNGRAYAERGERRKADAPGTVSFTLTQVDGTFVGPETLVEVVLQDADGATRMRFEQSGFPSPELRDITEEGWRECFVKLGEVLSR